MRRFVAVTVLLIGCHHPPAAVAPPKPKAPPPPGAWQTPMGKAILSRAPQDLDCPAERLRVRLEPERTWAAIGCSRRATYHCFCLDGSTQDCVDALCTPDTVAPSAK